MKLALHPEKPFNDGRTPMIGSTRSFATVRKPSPYPASQKQHLRGTRPALLVPYIAAYCCKKRAPSKARKAQRS